MNEERGKNPLFSKETGGSILFLLLVIIYLIEQFLPFDRITSPVVSLLITQGMILIPALIYTFYIDKNPVEFLRIRKFNIFSAMLIVVMMFTLLPVMALLNAISMLFSTNVIASSMQEITGGNVWMGLIFMAVLPAFVEEITFRGAVYRSLRGARPVRAIILTGFIFGAMHMNFNQFVYASALGIVMGFVIEATGSILSTMILHFCFNANSVILMSLQSKMMEFLEKAGQQIPQQAMDASSLSNSDILLTIAVLIPIAAIGAGFFALLYILIAKLNGRWNYIRFLFAKSTKPQRDALEKPRIVNIFTILGFSICFIFCLLRELFM